MNKSILILEENSTIHSLITSALDIDGLTLHHEFNPSNYVERSRSLMPDLILMGNPDQQANYAFCRELQQGTESADVPVVLLANSKETLDSGLLKELRVAGVIRKPFEASDLQQQVNKHLDLVDLIGSAYEYRKAGSAREEGINPLAGMEALEPEVLEMLLGAGEGGAADQAVPQPESGDEVGGGEEEILLDEEMLAEGLDPGNAFEKVEASGDIPPPTEALAGEAPSLGEDFSESATPLEEELEELGAADLLEEDTPEDAALEPSQFDETLAGQPAEGEPVALDNVEVEISESDVDYAALDEELAQGEVGLFESEVSAPPEAGPPPVGEDIPPAVQRMMDLRPVFSVEGEEAPPAKGGEEQVTFISGEEDLEFMAEELGQLDEIVLKDEPQFDHGEEASPGVEAEVEIPPEVQALVEEDAEAEGEDGFQEELLGEEEIDENKILEALEADATTVAAQEEPEKLEDSGFDSDQALLEELENAPDFSPAESEPEGSEDLVIDQDEEAMMLSALEEDETFRKTFEAAPEVAMGATPAPAEEEIPEEAVDFELEELEEESAGEVIELESGDLVEPESDTIELPPPVKEKPPAAAETADEFADFELPPLDEELEEGSSGEGTAAEPGATAAESASPGSETWTDLPAEERLEILAEEPLEGEDPTFDTAESEGGEFDNGEAGLQREERESVEETTFPEMESAEEVAFEITEESETVAAASGEQEENLEVPVDEGDFFADLESLREEITANPEGEILSDLLAEDEIAASAADLEFTIPQHENTFSRAIGISELPGEQPDEPEAAALPTQPAAAPPPEPPEPSLERVATTTGGELPLRLLDDEMKAKLAEVLEEIISRSVRKAMKEELPRLMESLSKDELRT